MQLQASMGINGITMIKIFLVDDQPSVRKGLRMQMALESDFELVGETGDSLSAPRLIAESRRSL